MRNWLLAVAVLLSLASTAPAAATQIDISNDKAVVEFPDRVTFSAELQSDTEIARVILEYGVVNQLTCGEVVAKAFPDITPGKRLAASWTWEMKQSGSEPPGAELWWQWRIVDSAGNEQVTDRQTAAWLDQEHKWKTLTGGSINLHWYNGGQSFGKTLHDSAVSSLGELADTTGLKPDSPIDLYIYANTDDMRDAVLYEPGWTGGLAYPDYNIVLIGIEPAQIDWGKQTQAHELTHVLVGHLTFSCLGNVPTWLNEGLAVYGEGGPDESSLRQLQEAIAGGTLASVRSLSGGFTEDSDRANLSYSQSYSLVNFLIEEYGRDKMLDLLRALRDGETLDDAMHRLYGFDIEGFEDAWRAKIGAAPRSAAEVAPTLTPTIVPTLVPVSGVPISPTLIPTQALSTAPPSPTLAQILPTAIFGGDANAPRTMFGGLAAICLSVVCITSIIAVVAAFVARRRGTKP
ncbi:MAG TPA: peptidase MA family metallohydrolase [Anaerolineales bacterium]|nr:peptidase MA family metallohydrolase [Anaerolineales bacterium]